MCSSRVTPDKSIARHKRRGLRAGLADIFMRSRTKDFERLLIFCYTATGEEKTAAELDAPAVTEEHLPAVLGL